MSVKLRGCEEELDQIIAALELPRRAALAIVITGAEGSGKTNLLRETASAATNLGYEVAALIQGSDWSRPVGLAGRDQLRQELFNALDAVPAGTPILIGVDDADRADPGRLARMRESTRRTYGANVVWALTASPGPRDAPTSRFRHHDQEYVTSIQLAGLAEEAVRAMVGDLLGAPPCNQLAAFAAQTGGNPRLVNELVTGLRDEGQLRLTGDEAQLLSDRIPLRLDILVRNRLSRLSIRCQQMLQVTAVLGRTVCPSLVAALPGETRASIQPILDEATASGILMRRDDELAFRSDLVRRVIGQTIPAPVRSALEIEVAQLPCRIQPRVPIQRSARTPWDDLTETEQTIAHLVSDGLTNRQIATRIYLSPHTVNYHLRRIFRKLDIASRVELATLATGHRRPA